MKSKNPISGVYKITSPIGMVYIGQSIDIRRRWVSQKGLQCKEIKKLYNSLITYGVDNHKFEIIHVSTDKNELNEIERMWQEYYAGDKSLNVSFVGTKNKKQIHSEESILNISKNMIGKLKGVKKSPEMISKRLETLKKISEEKGLYNKPLLKKSSNKGYPIIQLSKDLEFIKEWNNRAEASRTLKINVTSIRRVILGMQDFAGGFKWDVKHEENRYNTKTHFK